MLKQYNQKRLFEETPEPKGRRSKLSQDMPIFVVQKHDASHLHYDFRLEHNGVLLSWAVPKGPSLNPKEKHLAIQVEDHPFDYRDFEGTIPEGNYGAGTVMVWDEGTYLVPGAETKEEIAALITAGLKKGHLKCTLNGTKLQGTFQLVRLKKSNDKPQWLFFKSPDAFATDKPITDRDHSVKTGRSLDEIASGIQGKKKKVPNKKLPSFIKPMLATLVDQPFSDSRWLFEIKWDGYRALAYVDTSVTLYSRNKNVLNSLFPLLVEDLKKMDQKAILDGEIVVVDTQGHADFQRIQNYINTPYAKEGLAYYVFDLLFLNGIDLRDLPLIERKKKLQDVLKTYPFSFVHYSDHILEKGEAFFEQAKKHGLEGVIAKHVESSYHSGRTKQWLKIKTEQRQEVVIAGFTAPTGMRKKFGSLVLGLYDKQGILSYVGHVGTGFTTKSLVALYEKMQPLMRKSCPFSSEPTSQTAVSWIEPKLICEVTFSEWTDQGVMRHPVFKGLCIDKKAKAAIQDLSISTASIKKQDKKNVSHPVFTLSNPEKIYFPQLHYTKRDIVNYYESISSYILPYLKNRPMVLRRFPEGISGESFVQKNTSNLHIPSFMKTIEIEHDNKQVLYFVVQNMESIEYVVNLGSIEMHVFHATLAHLDLPDYFIIDLDPEDVPFDTVIAAAQTIQDLFNEMSIPYYWKTSGARGLHLYIPLGAKYTEQQVAQFGEILALMIHEKLPKITSLERHPAKRQHKIYIDVLQNRSKQTVIAPYSLRARPHASVSTPLRADELVKGMRPEDYTLSNTVARLNELGDLFAPVLGKAFDIKKWIKGFEKKKR